MWPTSLHSLRRKARCGFLSPLKIHHLQLGFTPLTLDRMASTLTTRPQRTTSLGRYFRHSVFGLNTEYDVWYEGSFGKIVWGGRGLLPPDVSVDSPDLCKLRHLEEMNMVPRDATGIKGSGGK
jgi:hypothetical protein